MQDLSRRGQVSEGSWSTFGRRQASEENEGIKEIFSTILFLQLPHLKADRGAALIWTVEGHPREEGRAVAGVQWYERVRKSCSDCQQIPRPGRSLRMRGYGLIGKGQLGACVTPSAPSHLGPSSG